MNSQNTEKTTGMSSPKYFELIDADPSLMQKFEFVAPDNWNSLPIQRKLKAWSYIKIQNYKLANNSTKLYCGLPLIFVQQDPRYIKTINQMWELETFGLDQECEHGICLNSLIQWHTDDIPRLKRHECFNYHVDYYRNKVIAFFRRLRGIIRTAKLAKHPLTIPLEVVKHISPYWLHQLRWFFEMDTDYPIETFDENPSDDEDDIPRPTQIYVRSETPSTSTVQDYIYEVHEHEHKCDKCGLKYKHTHAGVKGRDHKQFDYQCPNEKCAWYYKRGSSKAQLNPTKSELIIVKQEQPKEIIKQSPPEVDPIYARVVKTQIKLEKKQPEESTVVKPEMTKPERDTYFTYVLDAIKGQYEPTPCAYETKFPKCPCSQQIGEHIHKCEGCHRKMYCSCTNGNNKKCPWPKCQFNQGPTCARTSEPHYYLKLNKLKTIDEKYGSKVIVQALKESLKAKCDNVFYQIPSNLRNYYLEQFEIDTIRRIDRRKIAILPIHEGREKQQVNKMLYYASHFSKPKVMLQRLLNQVSSRQWAVSIKKNLPEPILKLRKTMKVRYANIPDSMILRAFGNKREYDEDIPKRVKKPKKGTLFQQQLKKIDDFNFDTFDFSTITCPVQEISGTQKRTIKRLTIKQAERLLKNKIEEIKEEYLEKKHDFEILSNEEQDEILEIEEPKLKNIQVNADKLITGIFDVLRNPPKVTTTKEGEVKCKAPYYEKNGIIYHRRQKIASLDDPHALKKVWRHVKNNVKNFGRNEFQGKLTDPIESYIRDVLTRLAGVALPPEMIAYLITDVVSFFICMASSIGGLIQEIRFGKSIILISVHVMAIVSLVAKLIMAIVSIKNIARQGSMVIQDSMKHTDQVLNSIVYHLVNDKVIDFDMATEILKLNGGKDAILPPSLEELEKSLEALKQPTIEVTSTTQINKPKPATRQLAYGQLLTELMNKRKDDIFKRISRVEPLKFPGLEMELKNWKDIETLAKSALGKDSDETAVDKCIVLTILCKRIMRKLYGDKTSIDVDDTFKNIVACLNTIGAVHLSMRQKNYAPNSKFMDKVELLDIVSDTLVTPLRHLTVNCFGQPTKFDDWYSGMYMPSLPACTISVFETSIPFEPLTISIPGWMNEFGINSLQSFNWQVILKMAVSIAVAGFGIWDYAKGSSNTSSIQNRIVLAHKTHSALKESAKDVKELVEDVAYDFFGCALGEKHYLRENGIRLLKQLEEYINTPNSTFATNVELYYEMKKVRAEASEYTKNIKLLGRDLTVGEQTILSQFVNFESQLMKKDTELKSIFESLGSRPETKLLFFYGDRGCGKSHLVSTWLGPSICSRQRYTNGVYDVSLNPDGNSYYKPYAYQAVGKVDEFLSTGIHDKLIMRLNELCSENSYNLEGAYEKVQPCGLKLLLISSNFCFVEPYAANPKGYSRDTFEAMFSRGKYIRVVNTSQYVNNQYVSVDRERIEHTENMTELRFFEYAMPGMSCYDRNRHMEALKTTFPDLNNCKEGFIRNDKGDFEKVLINPDEYKYDKKYWHKITYSAAGAVPVDYYIKEWTREELLEYSITLIRESEEQYDKNLRGQVEFYLRDKGANFDLEICKQELKMRGIPENVIREEVNRVFPGRFQSDRGTTSHLIYMFSGETGSGKTHLFKYVIAPKLQAGLANMDFFEVKTVKEARAIQQPSIVLINDVIAKDDGLLLNDILDQLPAPSIVCITENLYWKNYRVSSICNYSSQDNVKASIKLRPLTLLNYAVFDRIDVRVPYKKGDDGELVPLQTMHEGWYRRTGVEHFAMGEERKNRLAQATSDLQYIMLGAILTPLIIFYFLYGWLGILPALVISWLFLSFFQVEWFFPTISPYYMSPDICGLRRMISKGYYIDDMTGKEYLDGDIADEMFQKYVKLKTSMLDIKIIQVDYEVGSRTSDVAIFAPTLTDLPKFINDHKMVLAHIGATGDYGVLLSNNVQKCQFRTCITDFKLKENCTKDEVIDMAKRTYGNLIAGSLDFSVSVITANLKVYAHNGIIKYWLADSSLDSAWVLADTPDLTDTFKFHKMVNGSIVREEAITLDSICSLYMCDFRSHPSIDFEFMTTLWGFKNKITEKTSYKNKERLRSCELLSGSEIMKDLKNLKSEWQHIQNGFIGQVTVGLLTIVGAGVLAGMVWALYNRTAPKTTSVVDVSKMIGGIRDIPCTIISSGNGISQTHVGKITPTVVDVYDVYIDVMIEGASFVGPVYDSAIINQIVAQFRSHLINIVKIESVHLDKLRLTVRSINFSDSTIIASNGVNVAQTLPIKTQIDNQIYLISSMDLINKGDGYDSFSFELTEYINDEKTDNRIHVWMSLEDDNEISIREVTVGKYPKIDPHLIPALQETLRNIFEGFVPPVQYETVEKKRTKGKYRARIAQRWENCRASGDLAFVFETAEKKSMKLKRRLRGAMRFETVSQFEALMHSTPNNLSPPSLDVCRRKVLRNAVKVHNVTSGCMQYGLALKERLVVTNFHSFFIKDGKQPEVRVEFDDIRSPGDVLFVPAKIVYEDRLNDVSILQITDTTIPSFKNITSSFIREKDKGLVKECCLVRPHMDLPDVIGQCHIPSKLIPIEVEGEDGEFTQFNGRYLEANFASINFRTQRGDCGSPYLLNVGLQNNNYKIGGIHNIGNYICGTTCGVLLTYEMLEHYYDMIEQGAQYQSAREDVDIFTEMEFCDDDEKTNGLPLPPIYGDKLVVEEIEVNRCQQNIPHNDWPLFKPNQYHYGEIEDSNLSFITYTPRYMPSYAVRRRQHMPSIFSSMLEGQGYQNPVANSAINPFEVEDKSQLIKSRNSGTPSIILTQMSYYNDKVVPDPLFDTVVEDVYKELVPYWRKWFASKEHRYLSESEVVNGMILDKGSSFFNCIEGIDLKASPGFYGVRYMQATTKEDIYEEDVEGMQVHETQRLLYKYANTSVGRHMRNRFHNKLKYAKQRRWVALFYKDSLKDETVKKANVKIGKTRMFTADDDATVNFMRCVLGTYCASVKQKHALRHCQVGIDAYREFHRLALRLEQTGFYGEAGDYKHWDKNMLTIVVIKTLKLITAAVTMHMSREKKYEFQNCMDIIFFDIVHSYSFCDGIFYQKHRGMPSGTFLTAPLNSDVNFFYHVTNCKINLILYNRDIAIQKSNNLPLPETTEYIILNTDCVVYGDDKKSALSPEISVACNFERIRDVFSKYFGITYTDPSKSEKSYKLRKLEELDFLSRSSMKMPNGIVFPTLKRSSLWGMVFFTSDNTREVYVSTLMNLRKELLLLPEEEYHTWEVIFSDVIEYFERHYGPCNIPYLPPFEQNLQEVSNEILNI